MRVSVQEPKVSLSPLNLRVLELYEKDPNVKIVADKLGVTPKTVEWHLAKLKSFVGCTAREGLISWAFRSGLVYLLLLVPVIPAKAQLQNVTLQMQMIVDTNSLAGLSLADYCTNQWLEVLSSTNASTPTNQWPTLAWFPASQFLNQGLPPVWWTNQMLVDASTRFYLLRCTNGTGGLGPFSLVVPFFWTAPQGRINVKR